MTVLEADVEKDIATYTKIIAQLLKFFFSKLNKIPQIWCFCDKVEEPYLLPVNCSYKDFDTKYSIDIVGISSLWGFSRSEECRVFKVPVRVPSGLRSPFILRLINNQVLATCQYLLGATIMFIINQLSNMHQSLGKSCAKVEIQIAFSGSRNEFRGLKFVKSESTVTEQSSSTYA